VPEHAPADVVTGYLRALDRAEAALDADLAKYLPLWKLAVPADFENVHHWDFSKFGRGEPPRRIPHAVSPDRRNAKDRSFEHLAADLSG
jgi:hypothetical protein